jgi:hypothetical protein
MAELQFAPSVRDARGLGLEAVLARHAAIDPAIIQTNHLATVVEAALPAIAWGWDMLGPLWDALPDTATKRTFLLAVADLQGRRGTPWSVKTAMAILGWPNAVVIENQGALYYDGSADFDGYWWYGTAMGAWYEWAIELPLALADGFTAGDLALVEEIAQFYGPLRSRMVRTVLHMADITSSGGGAPSWAGGTALDRIGLWDGSAWHTRTFLSVAVVGSSATIRWREFGVDCPDPSTITKIGLIKADASVYAEQAITAIHKTAAVEMYGTWTISW